MGQESEDDEAGEGTVGEEDDAVATIARLIEDEFRKYKSLLPLTFYDNTGVLHNPLLWWKQKQFKFPILACLA